MATTRLMPLHTGKGRTVGQAISDIIDYTENPQKTDGGRLITSWQCDSRIADAEFLFTKNQYIQKTGRVRGEDDVIAYHLRQSFVPGEITPEDANRLGCELAKRFTKGNHAYIVCTHINGYPTGDFNGPGQKQNCGYWIPRASAGSWKGFGSSRKRLSAKENRGIYSDKNVPKIAYISVLLPAFVV